MQSDLASSGEETVNLSAEKVEDDDADPNTAKSGGDNQEIWSDSDSDLGSSSRNKLQPISKTPKSSSKRARYENGQNQLPAMDAKAQKTGEETNSPGSSDYKNLVAGDPLLADGEMGDDERKAWKKLVVEEVEAYARHLEVKSKQMKFLLHFMNPEFH